MLLIVLLSSCVDSIPQKPEPENLVEREKMVAILTDLSILETAYQLKYVQVAKYADQLKIGGDSILNAYKVSFEDFDQSMDFYGSDQEEMTRIYDDVKAKLETKRILMSYFASIYVRMILWIGIRDTTAGFKCYRRNVLETINMDGITFKGYAFQICMKYAALRHGFKVKEVPITFIDREYGESKMSTGIFKEAFYGVWKMRRMKL